MSLMPESPGGRIRRYRPSRFTTVFYGTFAAFMFLMGVGGAVMMHNDPGVWVSCAWLLAVGVVAPTIALLSLRTWIDLYPDRVELKAAFSRVRTVPMANIDTVSYDRGGIRFNEPGVWGTATYGPGNIGAIGAWPERVRRRGYGARIAPEIQAVVDAYKAGSL